MKVQLGDVLPTKLVAIGVLVVDLLELGAESKSRLHQPEERTGVTAMGDSAGSTVQTGGQAPDSVQGIWFIPGFGLLSEAQIQLFGPRPLSDSGSKQEEFVSISASYYVGIGVTLAGDHSNLKWEFSAGVASQCAYEIGPSGPIPPAAPPQHIVSPGVTSRLFTAVHKLVPGHAPVIISNHHYKKPPIHCGDTVLVMVTSTGAGYAVEFQNLTNFSSSRQQFGNLGVPDGQISAYAYWRVDSGMSSLSELGNLQKTFCDQAWCTVGKTKMFANKGKTVPLKLNKQTLVTCSPRATGLLEFACPPPSSKTVVDPAFG